MAGRSRAEEPQANASGTGPGVGHTAVAGSDRAEGVVIMTSVVKGVMTTNVVAIGETAGYKDIIL